MEIADLISPASVVANLRVGSKKQALQDLAKRAAETTGLPERAIFEVLLERERLGTTGVGNGIAIPHGKLPGLRRLYGLFARLETPIDFDSVDEQPVDLIFLLLAPEAAGADEKPFVFSGFASSPPSSSKPNRTLNRQFEIISLFLPPSAR